LNNLDQLTPVTPESFADVFELFERLHVQYVVVSGMAVFFHGYQRRVFDLDIVISAGPEQQNIAQQALLMAGFVATIPIPMSMATVLRMFDQSQREMDVFVRYTIPFAQLWSDSIVVPVGKTHARVASFEHLVKAKRITGRPHDLLDVAELLALRPGNDT